MLVSLLDILCSLVKEQPTAMALIREQQAWSSVKRFGSAEGDLSNVCQQIIKTLILNSHKFKKIRLSEAEAMALQDDENDRINFDERDRNAQYWLFKQLYHVLVQSSNTLLTAGWPATINHLTSAWHVTLELVRRVPDFFLFAVERGITDINMRLTDSVFSPVQLAYQKDYADLLGALLNFQAYVIVNFDLMNEEILHININQTKEILTDRVFPQILRAMQGPGSVRVWRSLLCCVLESSYVTELVRLDDDASNGLVPECSESGYDADDSESGELMGGVDAGGVAAHLVHQAPQIRELRLQIQETLGLLPGRLARLRVVVVGLLAVVDFLPASGQRLILPQHRTEPVAGTPPHAEAPPGGSDASSHIGLVSSASGAAREGGSV